MTASGLLALPVHVRERIYEYYWSDNASVTLCEPGVKHETKKRFPEKAAVRYPPYGPRNGLLKRQSSESSTGRVIARTAPSKPRADSGIHHSGVKVASPDVTSLYSDDAVSVLSSNSGSLDRSEETCSIFEKETTDWQTECGSEYCEVKPSILVAMNPPDLNLLQVSRQIHKEASTVFYRRTTFVLDADATSGMHFLSSLSHLAKQCLTSLTLTSAALTLDSQNNIYAWSANPSQQPYLAAIPHSSRALHLTAPFTIFLNHHLPSLSTISLYTPYSGQSPSYPPLAPLELSLLLRHSLIHTLRFIFLGSSSLKTLSNRSLGAADCYFRLMGTWATVEKVAERGFEMWVRPVPRLEDTKEGKERYGVMMSYCEERHEFVRREIKKGGFEWRWGEREGVEVGRDGVVQGVVECWRKDDEEDGINGL
ncbi:hypothetical protein Slin15195_G021480 [Septoria linicola]|uniref:Uncharacterized protein n=1 Tax=Septoria linicola TaxID=215465 RepID=A0A9Q9AG62_9PEZI|nr:hypothetical protein Slin14017_G129470 [Septoria linicola]USW48829.1 hypothetical protein Slin15195_G021480 [Septoria linicola]